jgi:hypothetical protein
MSTRTAVVRRGGGPWVRPSRPTVSLPLSVPLIAGVVGALPLFVAAQPGEGTRDVAFWLQRGAAPGACQPLAAAASRWHQLVAGCHVPAANRCQSVVATPIVRRLARWHSRNRQRPWSEGLVAAQAAGQAAEAVRGRASSVRHSAQWMPSGGGAWVRERSVPHRSSWRGLPQRRQASCRAAAFFLLLPPAARFRVVPVAQLHAVRVG